MRERIQALIGPRAQHMWISTFHSFCVRVLRREAKALGLKSTFTIYDSADSQRLLTLIIKELNLDTKKVCPQGRRAQDFRPQKRAGERRRIQRGSRE